MTAKRYNSLDLVKLLMAVVVIGIHTHPFENCGDILIQKAWTMLSGCAVPFFFLATGYLLAVKFKAPWDAPENLTVIRRYMGKTIKLYTVWSLIYLPLAVMRYVKEQRSFLYSILSYIRGFFLIGEHYNSWMLWYLLSSIYALLFVLACLKFHLPFGMVLLGGTLLFAISIGLDSLVVWEGSVPAVLQCLKTLTKLTIGKGRILRGAFYIPCGMALAKKKLPLIVNCIILPLAFTGGGYDRFDDIKSMADCGLRDHAVWHHGTHPAERQRALPDNAENEHGAVFYPYVCVDLLLHGRLWGSGLRPRLLLCGDGDMRFDGAALYRDTYQARTKKHEFTNNLLTLAA